MMSADLSSFRSTVPLTVREVRPSRHRVTAAMVPPGCFKERAWSARRCMVSQAAMAAAPSAELGTQRATAAALT